MDILQSVASKDVIVQTLAVHFRPPPGDSFRHSDDEHEDAALWRHFVDLLSRFHEELAHSSSGKRNEKEPVVVLPASDCCRILYRFDVHCRGRISTRLFQQCVIASLRDNSKSSTTNRVSASGTIGKQLTAVRNAKRPDVDAFSTPNAVQKLFLARAQLNQKCKPQSPNSQATTSNEGVSTRKSLVSAGNTHLARIRSLPVSKLLRYVLIPHTRTQRLHTGVLYSCFFSLNPMRSFFFFAL